MFAALAKAIAQLSDPRFRGALLRAVGSAAVLYILLSAALWWLLSSTSLFAAGWAEAAADILGGVAALALALLLFPAAVSVTIGLFLEEVAEAVEERHYPRLPPARAPGLAETVAGTLKFAAVALGLNLLALPLYLLLLVTGLGIVLFYLLNGYLLSREYFELVAARRVDPATAKALRRAHQGYLWLAGLVITFLLTLPLVNLVAPIVATAFMTHLFQSLRRDATLV